MRWGNRGVMLGGTGGKSKDVKVRPQAPEGWSGEVVETRRSSSSSSIFGGGSEGGGGGNAKGKGKAASQAAAAAGGKENAVDLTL